MSSTKLQEISRKVVSKTFFINMPMEVIRALNAKKGDTFQWEVQDKKTVLLKMIG